MAHRSGERFDAQPPTRKWTCRTSKWIHKPKWRVLTWRVDRDGEPTPGGRWFPKKRVPKNSPGPLPPGTPGRPHMQKSRAKSRAGVPGFWEFLELQHGEPPVLGRRGRRPSSSAYPPHRARRPKLPRATIWAELACHRREFGLNSAHLGYSMLTELPQQREERRHAGV